MTREQMEAGLVAPQQEDSLEERVRTAITRLLEDVITSAQQYQVLLESEQEKVNEARSALTDRAELHKQIASQLQAVEEAAEILDISLPEEPEEIEEGESFVKNWATLRQEVTDNEKRLVELANAVSKKPKLDILQAALSYQIGTLSSLQAQWGLSYADLEQTAQSGASSEKSVDTQISEVRLVALRILQGGPQIKTYLVNGLLVEGYERELVDLALSYFFKDDELIEGGWSTNTAAVMGRKGGAGFVFRLKTQHLPEGVHYFPRLTREQVEDRFKVGLVEELVKREEPLNIEGIIEWHEQFEGSRFSRQWYFWKLRDLAHERKIMIITRGTKELYAVISQEESEDGKPD